MTDCNCGLCRVAAVLLLFAVTASAGAVEIDPASLYHGRTLKPRDSELKVAVGDQAPDFTLPAVSGGTVRLSRYRRRRHVVLSFVPSAWTPVCSAQWPGYDIAKDFFEAHDAVLLGITVDHLATLHAWITAMGGLWFPVLSDFWPHGKVADAYGVLRSDGTSERALFVIDKTGTIRYIDVHAIDKRPDLGVLAAELAKLN